MAATGSLSALGHFPAFIAHRLDAPADDGPGWRDADTIHSIPPPQIRGNQFVTSVATFNPSLRYGRQTYRGARLEH